MKFSTIVLSASIALSSVFAVPHTHHRHQELHNEKRQSGYTPVTGPGGPVYPRLEIRQMYFNRPNQYTLLILALQKYQAMSQSDKLSYYQIAGIHGVPRVDWDGVGACSSCSSDGYCTHDSVLFPAWHRVYMALFEQQFLSIVNDIANSWTGDGADVIRSAASQMRWPYWDWAAAPKPGYNSFPTLMAMKYVTVTSSSGTQTIINPLFRYSFSDNSGLVYYPFVNNWKYTFRYPTSDDASATSQTSQVVSAFNNIRPSLQDQVWQLFSTCTDYLHFSNDDAGSSSTKCSNSLEGIHNTVHTTTGGVPSSNVAAGHMTYLSTAAFDPVFFLHHANVDRLFALWQALNPNSYGGSQTAAHSTWTIPAGSQQDENSPLTPFHKDTSGNFYSTNDVRDTKLFAYTYPEFAHSDGSQSAIASYVSALYGPGATATAGSSKRDIDEEVPALAERTPAPVVVDNVVAAASVIGFASPSSSSISGSLPIPTTDVVSNLTSTVQNISSPVSDLVNPVQANNGSLFQYVANIQTPRYALNGSYQIYLFNGKPTSEEPGSWVQDANLIGPVGILAQPGMTEHNVTVAASVPLTRTLTFALSNKFLTDLSEALVVPYLKANLYWRIAGPQGTSVLSDTLPGFNISVYGSTASQAPQGELPTYSDFVPLNEAVKDCSGNNA